MINKKLKMLFMIMSVSMLLGISNVSEAMPVKNSMPQKAIPFRNYLTQSKELNPDNAVYDPHTGNISFSTSARLVSPNLIRFRRIGYQITLSVKGEYYRTIMPEYATNSKNTRSIQQIDAMRDGNGNEVYLMQTSLYDNIIPTIISEFPNLTIDDFEELDLSMIRFDSIITTVKPGTNITNGSLNANGTTNGTVYFTADGWSDVSHAKSKFIYETAYDKRDNGILNAIPWSNQAKKDMLSTFGIVPISPKTDISASEIKMYSDKAGKNEIKEYIKGEPFYLGFEIKHLGGYASVGVKPPMVNPFAGVHFKLLEDDLSTKPNRKGPVINKYQGQSIANKLIHPPDISPKLLKSDVELVEGPFVVDDNTFIAASEILHKFHKKYLNIKNSNDIKTVRFKATVDNDLALRSLELLQDGKLIKGREIEGKKEYVAKAYMYHRVGKETIIDPKIDVIVKDSKGKTLLKETSIRKGELEPGKTMSITMSPFFVDNDDITITATISREHDEFNEDKTNDTVKGNYKVKSKDLSLTDLRLYDSLGKSVKSVRKDTKYKARSTITHEFGPDTITNPEIITTITDDDGNIIYKQTDMYVGNLKPDDIVVIRTGEFQTKETGINIVSVISDNLDEYNRDKTNDKVYGYYPLIEDVTNNYYIKNFKSTSKNINIPNGSSINRNIVFNVEIGHEIYPYRKDSATPNLVIRDKVGNIVWDGKVNMEYGSSVSHNIKVNTTLDMGSNGFTIEVNQDRKLVEIKEGVANPYLDNKASLSVGAHNSTYGIEETYVRTKWSRDTGKNDLPSQGKGWMKVGNGSTVKIKAGNGFETFMVTRFNYVGDGDYVSDSEHTSIIVPFTSMNMDLVLSNGSSLNSIRSFEIPNRNPLGVYERKIYTSLDTKVGKYRVDLTASRRTTLESFETHYSYSDILDEEGNIIGTDSHSYEVRTEWDINHSDSDYFMLEVLAQDDLKSHRMK